MNFTNKEFTINKFTGYKNEAGQKYKGGLAYFAKGYKIPIYENSVKKVTLIESSYFTEVGSIDLGGLKISNGYGDGAFKFYIMKKENFIYDIDGFESTPIWFDFTEKGSILIENSFELTGFIIVYKRSTSFYFVVDDFINVKELENTND